VYKYKDREARYLIDRLRYITLFESLYNNLNALKIVLLHNTTLDLIA